jgi:hypothetical protein
VEITLRDYLTRLVKWLKSFLIPLTGQQDIFDSFGNGLQNPIGHAMSDGVQGRYMVIDKDGRQVGTYDSLADAKSAWRVETDSTGRIIDTKTHQDVTPFTQYLSEDQLRQAKAIVNGWTHEQGVFDVRVNPSRVSALVERFNRMKLPIFDLANSVGGKIRLPTREMSVTVRSTRVVKQRIPYFENVPAESVKVGSQLTPEVQDDFEIRPIQTPDQLLRANPVSLVMPSFELDLARHDLGITKYQQPILGVAQTTRVRKWREQETTITEEQQKMVSVIDQNRSQALAIVCDISGSMGGGELEQAVALCIVLITKHLHDDSVYTFRWFASVVDLPYPEASNPRLKEKLISHIGSVTPFFPIGEGTNILKALAEGSKDVRRTRGNQPRELLLITDGVDGISAARATLAVKRGVILHTVIIGGDSEALKAASATYCRVDL